MFELILLTSIATKTVPVAPSPTVPTSVATPVAIPTPKSKPSYVTPPPSVPGQSWSDKMWQRYQESR